MILGFLRGLVRLLLEAAQLVEAFAERLDERSLIGQIELMQRFQRRVMPSSSASRAGCSRGLGVTVGSAFSSAARVNDASTRILTGP